jgi:hypothetical protein
LEDLLTTLINRSVLVTETSKTTDEVLPTDVYGLYHLDTGEVACTWTWSFAPLARAAGLLSLVSVDQVEEAIEHFKLDGILRDNAHEIMNVCASLHAGPTAPHIVFNELYARNDSLPATALTLVQSPERVVVFDLSVAGKSAGRIAIRTKRME